MSIKTVKAVSPGGQIVTLVESAFRKVWEDRGYRLVEDVEAAGAEFVDDIESDLGFPPAPVPADASSLPAPSAPAFGRTPKSEQTGAAES
jgi:hypothetical protein